MTKKFKQFLSLILSFIFLSSVGANALTKVQTNESVSDSISESAELPKNKIEEKDGVITINNKIVQYVPDSKIKISNDYINVSDEVKFVKPEELSSKEIVCKLFPEGFPKPEDVRQGSLGACIFLSVLSGLAENSPDFIKKNLIEYNDDFVIVKFFHYHSGFPIYVMVQKTIPDLLEDEGAFLSNNCLWVHMYLKAYVAMELVVRKTDSIDYENAVSGRSFLMWWVLRVTTGKEIEEEPWYTFDMKREYLYKKIEKTLNSKGVVLCLFDDSKLSKFPIFKYFFNEIKYSGLIKNHAYSISKVYKDENGIKWVCCRNPWGQFVPIYDKNGNLCPDDDENTDGYFWLKLKDFHKNCDKIYFSTEKSQ